MLRFFFLTCAVINCMLSFVPTCPNSFGLLRSERASITYVVVNQHCLSSYRDKPSHFYSLLMVRIEITFLAHQLIHRRRLIFKEEDNYADDLQTDDFTVICILGHIYTISSSDCWILMNTVYAKTLIMPMKKAKAHLH